MKSIAIMGAMRHCKVVADLALLNGYNDIVFIDKDPEVDKLEGYPVVDEDTNLDYYIEKKYDFAVGIGEARIRRKVLERLQNRGVNIVTLVHPSAVVASNVKIGVGTVVMAGAVINPCSTIGKGCIINTTSSVDHDNIIGNYCHISVGAHTAGSVTMGDNCWLGIGAVVIDKLTICEDVLIGAGAAVVKDISEPGTYVGVPASRIK